MTGEWAIDVPPAPSAVALARVWVAVVLPGLPGLVDDIQLMVSELVTDCVRHPASAEPVTIRLHASADRVRLEVRDREPDEDASWTDQDAEDFTLGLLIITELADAMGHERTADGHLAWAEMAI